MKLLCFVADLKTEWEPVYQTLNGKFDMLGNFVETLFGRERVLIDRRELVVENFTLLGELEATLCRKGDLSSTSSDLYMVRKSKDSDLYIIDGSCNLGAYYIEVSSVEDTNMNKLLKFNDL